MYERFEMLLKERGISAYKVSKDTGISTATLTSWKQGKYQPKSEKLKAIADYFGVTMEYLMTGKEPERGEGAILIDAGSITQDFNASSPALPSGGESAAKKQRELILTDTEIRLVLAFRNLPGETKLFILNAMGIKGVDPETEDATSMAAVS